MGRHPLCSAFQPKKPCIVITAGATREPLDPARFLTNRSSGKMALCLLREALKRRYPVLFVQGLISEPLPRGRFQIRHTPTARDMLELLLRTNLKNKILIMAAAVADFRPAVTARKKIKRTGSGLTLRLLPNPDILKTVTQKNKPLYTVGFAAETSGMLLKGRRKMLSKRADLLVANDVGRKDAGFGSDYTRAALLFPDGRVTRLGKVTKTEAARKIFDVIRKNGSPG